MPARRMLLIVTATIHCLTTTTHAQEHGITSTNSPARRTSFKPTVPETRASNAVASTTLSAAKLPPAPDGVTDLKFGEFFKPIGSRGLEHSDKLRALDGKRVRILGYMVKQSRPMPWTFLLSPVPVTLHETEYGFAEDMPATVLHVFTPRNATPIVPFTPGLMLLTGTLSVGNREEPDGRVSTVRLTLDPPTPEQRAAMIPTARATQTISTNAVVR